MNRIVIDTIPHYLQAYPTVGNYREYPNGEWGVEVSALPDWRYELLVALHEIIEAALCKQREIAWADIDAFDIAYEFARSSGDTSEPGDAPDAPYRREHRFAENIERQIAHELGVDWAIYEQAIGDLP